MQHIVLTTKKHGAHKMLVNHKILLILPVVICFHLSRVLLAASSSSMILQQDIYSDAIPRAAQELRRELNEEFMERAHITGLVSYIYYPYAGDTGHAELEIEGTCFAVKGGRCMTESLDQRLLKRRRYQGVPFYRYVISVTPAQMKRLSEHVGKRDFVIPICSLNALTELSRSADYSVPFVCRLSPLISSYALSFAKLMGSRRIKAIEFYGCEKLNHLMAKGVAREMVAIGMVLGAATFCTLVAAGALVHHYVILPSEGAL